MSLKERVAQRVEELGVSPLTLAQSVGLERGFIRDIIEGRKKSVRKRGMLELVAKALRCDVDYLLERQDQPRVAVSGPGIPVLGVCHTDTWRSTNAPADYPSEVPVAADVRYPHLAQGAYILRGVGPNDAHRSMTVAVTVEVADFVRAVRPVDADTVVIVQRERDDLAETSIRVVKGHGADRHLCAFPGDAAQPAELAFGESATPRGVTVVGVVTAIVRLYL